MRSSQALAQSIFGSLALSSSAMSGREQCHTPGAAHAALH